MIVEKPTEKQIRSAHVITLFDPQRPEYHRVVVDTLDRTQRTPLEVMVIDIPVRSSDPQEIAYWIGAIASVRSGE
jgi:hypothetical protein